MAVLSLLRHAKAVQPLSGQQDFDRPLTERGRRNASWAGKILASLGIEAALVSAACRTLETWEIANQEIVPTPKVSIEKGLYLCSSAKLIARLREIPADARSVVVVGHNPCMQEVAYWLARHSSGADHLAIGEKFPTCALAIFDIEDGAWGRLSPEGVALKRFLTPRGAG
jgi:phosphohistidine phosphatase